MNILGKYKNGNYAVALFSDGTKMRYNNSDSLLPEFPESFDFKITDQCDGVDGVLCPYCHEGSTPAGKHGDIMNMAFIDTLRPYTEIAIGGGNTISHPDLVPFLERCKSLKLVPSMTVNQHHFMNNIDFIKHLVDSKLIYGLGVSLVSATDDFIKAAKEFPNMVIHIINGVVRQFKLENLANNNFKILILGYKELRRGEDLYNKHSYLIKEAKKELYDVLPKIIEEEWFEVVSFDNLAIEQLEPKRLMSDEEWNEFYMGEDGEFTFYVDGVSEEFAVSSTSMERYDLTDNVVDMFNVVRKQ